MNIHQIEQRILINELMNKKSVTKQMLADALIANGHCGIDPLPVKNTVRMNMITLQRKCKELGFGLYTINIGGPAGTDYAITEEAIRYIGFNYAEPQYDEMGEMIGQLYLFPAFSQGEEE
jgi:hypothetical protein